MLEEMVLAKRYLLWHWNLLLVDYFLIMFHLDLLVKDYQDIINIVHIICFNRKNCNFTHLPNMSLTWIEDFKINISSEQIKKDIIKGEFNKDNLPSAVKQYIIKNQLYGYK